MILSMTPFRCSLFGGGSDYPDYYRDHGGTTLGFAIDKFCYISVRRLPKFFGHKHRIVYSNIELVSELAYLKHPSVRAVLTELAKYIKDDGLEIHHFGDLPARSGLGSSSAFTVGLLNATLALYRRRLSKAQLATVAIMLEQDVIGETIGSQDQVFAANGDLNRIDFSEGGIVVSPLNLHPRREREMLDHLILLFTGTVRIAEVIARSQVVAMDRNRAALLEMADMARRAETILIDERQDVASLGPMLHEGWLLKRSLSSLVSTTAIDTLYATARSAGATGGKILGAGGGGFFLLFAPPERHQQLLAALPPSLVRVPVGIDREGSRIVLNEPNGLG